jgi:hypothetical protein
MSKAPSETGAHEKKSRIRKPGAGPGQGVAVVAISGPGVPVNGNYGATKLMLDSIGITDQDYRLILAMSR